MKGSRSLLTDRFVVLLTPPSKLALISTETRTVACGLAARSEMISLAIVLSYDFASVAFTSALPW